MTYLYGVSITRELGGRSRGPATSLSYVQSKVSIANEKVSIVELLNLLGFECQPPSEGRSIKIKCPFGFEHRDFGHENAFRVYSSNTGFCFAGHGFMTPVWLAAQSWDVEPEEAASRLLGHIGWVDATDAEQLKTLLEPQVLAVDTEALSAALRVWCGRQADWSWMQYQDAVARALAQLTSLLPLVSNGDDAAKWLDRGKQVMARVMGMVSSR